MAWPSVYGLDGAQLRQNTEARRPTVFLVHDHFLTPTHLAPLHNELLSSHRVYSPQLPSTGFRYQANVVEADVRTLVDAAKPELRTGTDMVFVMFGYGGVPGSLAAQRLNSWSLETPRAGRISKLVFISALLLNEDEALKDVVSTDRLEMADDRMCRLKEGERRRMFEPCSPRILPTALTSMQHLNSSVLTTPVPLRAWASIPALYVICEQDEQLLPETQECFAQRLQAANRHAAVVRFPAGHSPFLTHTTQTAALISRLTRPPAQ